MNRIGFKTAWILLCLPWVAHANHQDEALELDTVEVKSSKPAFAKNPTSSTEGVTAKQIEESANTATTAGALQYLPSVHVRERYIGDRNGILVMRLNSSIASAQTTVYADGLLISNFLNNSFSTPPRWGMVSPDLIERIDIMYGPFSALYPGNSAGGVLNITTRMPKKFEAHLKVDAFTQKFKLYGADQTFNGDHESASIGDKFGDLSVLLSLDHLDSKGQPQTFSTATRASTIGGGATAVTGGYRDTDPQGLARIVTATTGMDHTVQDNATLKLAYDISPQLKASYSLNYWRNDTNISVDGYLRDAATGQVIYNTTSTGATRRVTFAGDPNQYTLSATAPSSAASEHWMHGWMLKTDTGGAWDWELIASLYQQSKEQTRTYATNTALASSAYADGSEGSGTLKKDNGTGWKSLDVRGEWRPGGGLQSPHLVSLGYHVDQYQLESETLNVADWQRSTQGTLASNSYGKTMTQAVYLQDAWALSPAWKLITGGRWEHWQAFDGSNYNVSNPVAFRQLDYADRAYSNFSPKLSLSYQAREDLLFRGSYGKAYRYPTVAEMFQVISLPGNIRANDPNLLPEQVNSLELSAEKGFAKGFSRVSWFFEDKTDALISQTDTTTSPGTSISSVQNVDKIRSQGVEATFQFEDVLIHGLDMLGSVTYVDSEIIKNSKNPATEGKPQPRIPDWRATVVGTYHFNDKLSWSVAGRYSGHQEVNLLYNTVDPDKYGTTVSQYTVFDTKLLYKVNKHWTAALGINNLNNYKYYVNPNPYPQRTLFATLKFDY